MRENKLKKLSKKILAALILLPLAVVGSADICSAAVADIPLFLSQSAPPLNLLVLGRDHKLYYEAYNDASDLDGDGTLDVGYKPTVIDYYGYFDSFKCYEYNQNGTIINLLDNDDSRIDDFFEPTNPAPNKTCTGANEWSGDFLNYLTTSRIDALRKVLYGGKRSTDSTSKTILERSHIPQDAHSWGKEYTSIAVDGFDITKYSPLSLPHSGTRHLFANTSLLKNDSGTIMTDNSSTTETEPDPLFRVLNDSQYRVWEWLSIERPVAGDKCNNGGNGPACEQTGGTVYQIVPAGLFSGLTQTVYSLPNTAGHPNNHAAYDTYVATYATAARKQGSQAVATINGNGNPFGADDWYLTIFKGDFVAPVAGNYTFAIDGDDAVELIIDGTVVADFYGGHGTANNYTHNGTVFLTAGNHSLEFRHEENTGGDSYKLFMELAGVPTSEMKSYAVRVEVCKTGYLEANCQAYPNSGSPVNKPIGLLHEYGEDGRMKFGLLTGSYANNTQGGVLRKAVSDFNDEVNPNTGQFTNTVGIVKTIDRLKIVDFAGNYQYDCGWITTRAMNNGECSVWGNPIAEMMYEGVRYFAGKGESSNEFEISASGNDDATLGLPIAAWDDPYTSNPTCAQPFQLVISDINPSYDSDSLPGVDSDFGTGLSGGQHLNFDVETLGGTIWDHEFGAGTSKSVFIGQLNNSYDGAPSLKSVSSFGNIRGLAPEEPTKQGSYYAASVAYYAQITDLNTAADDQKMNTFSVALASPLPQIVIPVNGKKITLVPFAKSVGGSSISAASGSFQPTNTIVDFYIDTITPTSGLFRINYEDVEQGADHDMDAIVEYSYLVNGDGTVSITLNSTYAAGGIIQHMGYVISGTTEDGTYLEVRDRDTAEGSDPDYFLDTPPGVFTSTGGVDPWDDNTHLPLSTTRTFTPDSSGAAATFLKDPLWYAAKYGFFDESVDGATKNQLPDTVEYDKNNDGTPDNYYLVTNALTLSQKLGEAFDEIVGVTTSAAAVATNSTRLDTNTFVYQASFNTETWAGQLKAFPLEGAGTVGPANWAAADLLKNLVNPAASRNIFTYKPTSGNGTAFLWTNLDIGQKNALKEPVEADYTNAILRVAYLRGEQCNEVKNELAIPTATCGNGLFRDRSSVLGDIVNSDPWFVGQQNYGYTNLPGAEGADYFTYRTSASYLSRTNMLYVGSNDGMLHAFNAGERDLNVVPQKRGGDELFAYVPDGLIPKLNALTDPNYTHQYYVDGPVRATDAYLDLDGNGTYKWETILVGSLGAGGKGMYALRVTDPDNFSASDVLWEINTGTAGYAGLGFVMDQPFIVRMANGTWAAVYGNGYGSTGGQAILYVTNLVDGSLIKSINVGGTLNGLSGASPVDFVSGVSDSITDTVYAGDLLGNLWKFNVTDIAEGNWDCAFKTGTTCEPLFTARGPSNNVQPITARLEIGRATATAAVDDLMIYFGTGQYFETGDNIVLATPAVQSFYGILDNGSRIGATDRSSLERQEITVESTVLGFEARALSNHPVDYTTKRGWFLDLVSPVSGAQGERVVNHAQLVNGKLIYVTLIPNLDACQFGGDSWLMIVDPATGGSLESSIFDLNADNAFDSNDFVTDPTDPTKKLAVSGKKSTTGIISAPAVIIGENVTHLVTSGTDTTGDDGGIGDDLVNIGDDAKGRKAWRQLR